MVQLVLATMFLLGVVFLPGTLAKFVRRRTMGQKDGKGLAWTVRVICSLLCLFMILSTSFVIVDGSSVGHLKRVYMGSAMPAGRIVALPGEKGPQAEVLAPGFHFRLFVRVLFDFEEYPVIRVPEGQYGIITALDGRPLRNGQYLADAWPEEEYERFLDALYFMGQDGDGPRGQKGSQLTILPPGQYRLNHYLFDVDIEHEAIDIEAGFVGVVKSNVGDVYEGSIAPDSIIEAFERASTLESKKAKRDGVDIPHISREEARQRALEALSVPLVPRGYRGVWTEVLTPGRYYFNEKAYQVTKVDTRIQTWPYIGGFTRRWVDLQLKEDGTVVQSAREEEMVIPEHVADRAVVLRVEGWDVFLDSRVLVQVTPDNAPYVVASVGGIRNVEDKIITPAYRSVLRNVVGDKERKVLDLLYQREMLEKLVEEAIIPEGLKAGVIIREIRFGDPVVPPELLIPGKRKQLAEQMEATFIREKEAQLKRIETEKARAEANRQDELMKAQIRKKAAAEIKEEQRLLGEGEKLKLQAIAEGQRAQMDVLGQQKTYELARLQMILETAAKNPNIVRVPHILVNGSAGGFEGAAAILGASNLSFGMDESTPTSPAPPGPQGKANRTNDPVPMVVPVETVSAVPAEG
jgi:regulator of protease activity HflC (stomatin/prohibitin superfamily)